MSTTRRPPTDGAPGGPGDGGGDRLADWGSDREPWEDRSLDQLVTGEAVALELPPASVAQRLASGLVDLVLQVLLLVGLLGLMEVWEPSEALGAAVGVAVGILVLVVGPATVEARSFGRTPGKLLLGLRAVRDDGGPVSFHHTFVRHLLSLVEVWVLLGVPALVTSVASSRGKRLGDMVAGTYVVGDRYRLRLPPAVAMPPPLAQWAASADLGPLPAGLLLGVRQLLARQHSLSPQAHARLVDELVHRVAPHVAPPPPSGTPPLAFLAAVVAERRRRDGQRLWREGELRRRLTQRVSRER